jgi:hypothetical protein
MTPGRPPKKPRVATPMPGGHVPALLRDARLLNGCGERNGKGLMRGDAVKAARAVEAHAEAVARCAGATGEEVRSYRDR